MASDIQLIDFVDVNKKLNTYSIQIKRKGTNNFDAEVYDADINANPQTYVYLYGLSSLGQPTALDALDGALTNLKGTKNFSGLKDVKFQIVDDIITLSDFNNTLNTHSIVVSVHPY